MHAKHDADEKRQAKEQSKRDAVEEAKQRKTLERAAATKMVSIPGICAKPFCNVTQTSAKGTVERNVDTRDVGNWYAKAVIIN